jgi:hypothetical protein
MARPRKRNNKSVFLSNSGVKSDGINPGHNTARNCGITLPKG